MDFTLYTLGLLKFETKRYSWKNIHLQRDKFGKIPRFCSFSFNEVSESLEDKLWKKKIFHAGSGMCVCDALFPFASGSKGL